jgi:hypothetical protein
VKNEENALVAIRAHFIREGNVMILPSTMKRPLPR